MKDNIETADAMPTTAGSLALKDNVTHRDAPAGGAAAGAGAVILGKTNLSEWANFRSNHSISGWSGVGGLVKNPYVLDRSACGSSSGSGAAVAASLAAAAIGTETDGSLVCPARSTAWSASSRPWAWSRAPTSCRSPTARTRPGRWRAVSPTRRWC